jgi:plasmid stability protein
MAQLLVRDVDDAIVKALRERAARNGRSAEAEHREILATALCRTRRRSLAQALAEIPNVGIDDDFVRIEDSREARRVSR